MLLIRDGGGSQPFPWGCPPPAPLAPRRDRLGESFILDRQTLETTLDSPFLKDEGAV